MISDIEIASQAKMKNIKKIAKKLKIKSSDLELYGDHIAKIKNFDSNLHKQGKLILVTAMTPTSAGEGKSTVSIGLSDALNKLKKNACLALREPSLGPVFGIKGGACGGGYSQVLPMENINLHFTGDMHAITSANNLLSAIIDNHIHQGNELDIQKVYFERCIDLNDRALKNIEVASGRKDKFTITSASEVMAILALANNLENLKKRLGQIIVGENTKGKLIFARDLKAENAMTILLKDVIKPNLVQTIEGTPAIIHAGPFANVAHGCNSVIATKFAISHSDYTVTEAGFGSDLGAEKFLDLKCQLNNLKPDCVCMVATIRALKLHGGEQKENLSKENIKAVEDGFKNLKRHIKNIKNAYKLPLVVAINKFGSDTDAEIQKLQELTEKQGVEAIVVTNFCDGAKGAINLAKKVIELADKKSKIEFVYNKGDSIKDKIKKIAKEIYKAEDVVFTDEAKQKLEKAKKNGFNNLPVVIAKTQYSFSGDKTLLNAPKDFVLTISDIIVRGGAEFVVAIAGNMLLMPGLAKHSAYENMEIDTNGIIKGLF